MESKLVRREIPTLHRYIDYCASILAQVSRKPTVRLNTKASGEESLHQHRSSQYAQTENRHLLQHRLSLVQHRLS